MATLTGKNLLDSIIDSAGITPNAVVKNTLTAGLQQLIDNGTVSKLSISLAMQGFWTELNTSVEMAPLMDAVETNMNLIAAAADDAAVAAIDFPSIGEIPGPATISVSTADVNEGEDVVFIVKLNKAADSEVKVDFATDFAGGADADDIDGPLPSGTLTFAAGDTSKTITIPVVKDAVGPETGEGIELTLSNLIGTDVVLGSATATANIIDKPVDFVLTASSETTREGQEITFTVEASVPVTEDTPVKIQTLAGDPNAPDQGSDKTNLQDFDSGVLSSHEVKIPAGQKSVSYTIINKNDSIAEYDESFTVQVEVNGQTLTKEMVLKDFVNTTFAVGSSTDNLKGTILDDTFTATQTELTSPNTVALDGDAGEDTLKVADDGSAVLPATIKNIEKIDWTSSAGLDSNALDVSNVAGLTSLDVEFEPGGDSTITAADTTAVGVTVTDLAHDVTVVGGSAVNVTVEAASAAKKVTATKLESLTLKGSIAQDVTVDGGKTLTLIGDEADVPSMKSIIDAKVENLTIETTGKAASNLGAVKAQKVKAVTITGDQDLTVDLGDVGNVALKTIDATKATGDVTLDVKNLKVAVKMGAGDDTVSGALTDQTLDGGDGEDTLLLTSAQADALTAKITGVSNFEKLGVGDTSAATTVNMQFLPGFTGISSMGTTTGTLTVNNMEDKGSFEMTALVTNAVTLNLTNATGDNDTLNLAFTAADGFVNVGAIATPGVENLNIVTNATDDTTSTVFTAPITAAAVKTVNVAGNRGIDLTGGLAATTLTKFDASGVTAEGDEGAVKLTTAALAEEAVLTGGAGKDVIDASAATKSVTINGGAGDDTLTAGAAGSTLNGGEGDDTLKGGNGKDIINGGAGDDIIEGGKGNDVLTGGEGNDTFKLVVNSSTDIYSVITDAASGDILSFADKGTERFTTAKIELQDTANFQQYLDQAAKGDGGTDGIITWFQYDGNTYVVSDNTTAASFTVATDTVVRLTGLVDLSEAVVGDHCITLA